MGEPTDRGEPAAWPSARLRRPVPRGRRRIPRPVPRGRLAERARLAPGASGPPAHPAPGASGVRWRANRCVWEPAAARGCRTGTVEDRPLDESELVARAKRGDLRAYGEIVEQHQTIAFRTAWLITGSAADAEEAAQDAFVKAHAALRRFRAGAPVRPWLLKIVSNEARSRRAAAARRERLTLRAAAERRPGDAVPSPEAALLDAERRSELLAAVERLDERDRTAIACRYFLELSEAETAAALGVARGTVKSRLSRALGRLRGELEAGDA